jgi:hypothetical protein
VGKIAVSYRYLNIEAGGLPPFIARAKKVRSMATGLPGSECLLINQLLSALDVDAGALAAIRHALSPVFEPELDEKRCPLDVRTALVLTLAPCRGI